VSLFVGRTGFGEDPPFPRSEEAPYDLVICSGVVSFAYDVERWLDGLTRAVAPGGTLVFGDINPGSRGMRSRRSKKPLLPVREMNALPRDQALLEMQTRGFKLKRAGGYQLTWPMPQAMHFDETRLNGVFSKPLLLANRAFAGFDGKFGSPLANQFDSWVMHLER
ncbi:MAG: class I SAM-dependent methyltransferase, partial [Planctomycetota bacterium]